MKIGEKYDFLLYRLKKKIRLCIFCYVSLFIVIICLFVCLSVFFTFFFSLLFISLLQMIFFVILCFVKKK